MSIAKLFLDPFILFLVILILWFVSKILEAVSESREKK